MSNTSPNREPQAAQSPSTTTLLAPVPDTITGITPDTGPDVDISLTPAQQQAMECLFDGGSITEAARTAGVTRQTVSRWIRTSVDFKTVYDAWHREIQASVKDRLAAIGDNAMDNIAHAIRINSDLRASVFVVKHLLARKEQ